MRVYAVLGLSLLALTACSKKDDKVAAATGDAGPAAGAAPVSGPMAAPKRKPGLWSQTVASEGNSQTIKLCLDAATEAKLSVWGAQAGSEACAQNTFMRTATGFSFDSVCDMGPAGKITTKGVGSGDFDTRYEIKATSVTTGASMGQANGTREMTITGTWDGACPAGMKPGDMSLPGGVTMNINDIPAMKK